MKGYVSLRERISGTSRFSPATERSHSNFKMKNSEKLKMITESKATDFESCPEGIFQAVCVDVIDLGHQEQVFQGESKGLKPMCKLVFQVDEKNDAGWRYCVWSRKFIVSSHPRASLRQFLDTWFGQKNIQAAIEAGGFDEEGLIGQNARIKIEHNESNNTVYANIATIMPWTAKDGPLMEPDGDYDRKRDRDDWAQPKPSAFEAAAAVEGKSVSVPTKDEAPAKSPAASDPLTAGQMGDIAEQARITWPNAGSVVRQQEIEKLTGGKSVKSLTRDEAAKLIHDLRETKPDVATVDPNQVPADWNPFADPGDEGYYPEEVSRGWAEKELAAA